MIFYFTGTGNSGYIAKELSERTEERLISISSVIRADEKTVFSLGNGEKIGFVYPIYAWAPPKTVMDFIENLELKNYNGNYIFAVETCGDNAGNSAYVLRDALKKKDMILRSCFTIQMPNNYVILGGVDSKEIEDEKLKLAEEKILKIKSSIQNEENDIFDMIKGPIPGFFTGVINPVFIKNPMKDKKFNCSSACISCGKCVGVCNAGIIKMEAEKPFWNGNCMGCLSCYHHCPVRAIDYGSLTKKKGQYVNPCFKGI